MSIRINSNDIIKKIEPIFEMLFMLSVILNSSTMYQVMESFTRRGINSFTLGLLSMALSCILIVIYLLNGKNKFTNIQVVVIVGCAIFFIVYLIMTRFQVRYCVTGLFLPLELFTIQCSLKGPEKAFRCYFFIFTKLVVLISAISLFFYFGGTLTGIIPGQQMRYMNFNHWYDGTSYYNLAFINPVQTQNLFGHVFIRNVGIYMEAPAFAAPLCFSLFWELFAVKRRNMLEIAILVVTMATTFSSKALVIGAALLFLDLVVNGKKTTFSVLLKIMIVPASLFALYIFYRYLFEAKLESKSNLSSASIRVNDTMGALMTFLKHPIFGAGYCNFEEIYQNSPKHLILKGAPTAGLVNILALGGIYMGAGTSIALSFFFRKLDSFNHGRVRIPLVFIIIFLVFLFISSSQYSKFTILVLAIGLSGFMYHPAKQWSTEAFIIKMKERKNAGNLYLGS